VTHVVTIPGWRPALLNELMGRHPHAVARRKRVDRDLVAGYCRLAELPGAAGRRRVSLVITLGPRGRECDPDAPWKSLLDALVQAGALVDDSADWCELGTVAHARGPSLATAITLEDV
jgi:hypothetical protein